jgi:peptidyl-prolyl cis-trans isomerase B (cyclophilin B)
VPPSKERQRALARAKLERQMARRAEAARRRRRIQAAIGAAVAVVAVIAGTVFLVVKFGGSDDKSTAAAPPSCSYPAPAEGTVEPATVKDVGTPPTDAVARTGTRTATLTTSAGAIEVSLDQAKAPCAVNSFAFLAGKKFFDKTTCHRLTTADLYVLQCGDPSGTGKGGPKYRYGVENLPTGLHPSYPAGTLAMANSDSPDSNGSQFFIVYKDTDLPASYTIFGKVTKGLDVVQKVAKAGVAGGATDGAPKQKVTIQTVTLGPASQG